jgi:hypothetical protein
MHGLASDLKTGLLVYIFRVNKVETILSPAQTELWAA